MQIFISSMVNLTRNFWENKPIQDVMKSKEYFDVVISLNFLNDAILALNHLLGTPTIIFFPAASSIITNKYVANPNLPYMGNPVFPVSRETSFISRLMSATVNAVLTLVGEYVTSPLQESAMKTYLPNSPSVSDLGKNVSLVLVNSHTSIEPIR